MISATINFSNIDLREQGTGDQMNNQASSSSYMTHLKLTIRNLTAKDFTSYRCVAKNPRGETDGTIKVYREYKYKYQQF